MVRSRKRMAWVISVALLAGACTLDEGADMSIDYDTKVVDYMLPVGVDGEYEPVLTKVYDSTGDQVGEFILSYDGDGLNDETRVYEVEGTAKTLAEYYLYTYDTVTYEGEDIFRLTKGETYDPEDTLQLYYDVTYDADLLDSYTLVEDFEMVEEVPVPTAQQISTYIKDTDLSSYGEYRTEQYLAWNSDTSAWDLKSEYASWYDEAGNYTAELYHVIRGSTEDPVLPEDTVDDAYFYVPFSRDSAGNVYVQCDRLYWDTSDGIPAALKQANGSFLVTTGIAAGPAAADPFPYDLLASAIGDQVDMLMKEFDDLEPPNVVRRTRYIYGALQEVTVCNFSSDGDLLDEARYVRGGKVLDEKTAYRYSEDTIEGTTYRVRQTYSYSYSYDVTEEESKTLRCARALFRSQGLTNSRGSYEKVGNNHARQNG